MLLEAFARGRSLTMEIAAVPDSVRRITLLVERMATSSPSTGRSTTSGMSGIRGLTDLQGEWPVWTTGHMIVRDITDV